MTDEDLTSAIMDVWQGYDDFKNGGLDYVAFLQRQNVDEMLEAETEEGAAEELADQAICAIRQLEEMGFDPEQFIQQRLDERMAGQQEDIIHSSQNEYELQDIL